MSLFLPQAELRSPANLQLQQVQSLDLDFACRKSGLCSCTKSSRSSIASYDRRSNDWRLKARPDHGSFKKLRSRWWVGGN